MTNFTSNDETKIKSKKISGFLQSRIEAKDFPSAVYLVAEQGKIVLQDALGFAVVEPKKIEASVDTIYDLASLTKVLVIGLLCAKLIEKCEINLSDKVLEYSHFFSTELKSEVKIENLLIHTSGFQSWSPLYLVLQNFSADFSPSDWLNIVSEIPNENPLNSKIVYSDLNFIALGFILEEIYDQPLDEIARKEIFEPLYLKDTLYNPPKELQRRIAASEKGNEFEKNTCIEQGYLQPSTTTEDSDLFRDYQIWGEVHDGNCWFMNGVSGHAGLFSPVEDVFKIAQQFLPNQTTLLNPETCKLFRTNFTPGLNEARSIAFQLAETPESTASKALSKDSFGHLGFTGTSLWIEPETERIFILLTNRTHDHELPFVNINSVRRKFHELATEILSAKES